jgi:hypothetical protein
MTKRCVAWALVLSGSCGCASEDPVNIGQGRTGEKLSDYGAIWDGYAESHQFIDGSDRLRISLDNVGAGNVIAGDSPPFLPTDARHFDAPVRSDGWLDLGGLIPGFAYTVQEPRVDQSRLRLDIDALEPFRGWCSQQTPVERIDSPGSFGCVNGPAVTGQGPNDACSLFFDGSIIDCHWFTACMFCECTATECHVVEENLDPGFAGTDFLDAVLDKKGQEMVGTMRERNVRDDPGIIVRLQRAP